jgi:hypothetical protein
MKELEEYYLLMRYLFVSLDEIKKMDNFEREYLVNELKKK